MNNEFMQAWKDRQSAEQLNSIPKPALVDLERPEESFFQKIFSWLKGNSSIETTPDERKVNPATGWPMADHFYDIQGNLYGFSDAD